jgi:N,N'-diacetyllegionaminate synthase
MSKNVYVIAEIGINHCGKIKIAKQLIDIAKKSGANAVKFQTYNTDKLINKDEDLMPYQKLNIKKKINQFEMLKQNELSESNHIKLIKYCKKKKIEFISTPYDIESAKLLIKLGLKIIKIASTDITNVELIRYLLSKKIKLILSTGATNLNELDILFKIIGSKNNLKKISLLHCVSFYPAPIQSLNLKVINNLKKRFKVKVGFSDHSLSNFAGSFAIILGAEIIEKHITLSHKLMGPDHKASLEPKDFYEYVNLIRDAQKSLGDGIKKVEKVEKLTKKSMQKSIIVTKDLIKGAKINFKNTSSMRPATGISPLYIDKLIGKKLNHSKKKNEIIFWKDLYKH